MSGKAVVHVKTVRTKSTQQIIGFRLEAAVPNLQGRVMRHLGEGDFYATDQVTPSFRGKYLIAESSDFQAIGKRQIERFQETLRWNGYDSFEYIGSYDGEPFVDLVMQLGF